MNTPEVQELVNQLGSIRANIDGWKEHEQLVKDKLVELGYFKEFGNLLAEWYLTTQAVLPLKEAESNMRKSIFSMAFPEPKEGTNSLKLADGYVLKGIYGYNRKVDNELLTNIFEKLVEAEIPIDMLVKYKPEVKVTIYKALSEQQRNLFDQCLTIEPGSPSLKIEKPKRVKD